MGQRKSEGKPEPRNRLGSQWKVKWKHTNEVGRQARDRRG